MFQLIIPIQNKQKQFNKFNQYWTKKCGLGMELLPKVYFSFWGLLWVQDFLNIFVNY